MQHTSLAAKRLFLQEDTIGNTSENNRSHQPQNNSCGRGRGGGKGIHSEILYLQNDLPLSQALRTIVLTLGYI